MAKEKQQEDNRDIFEKVLDYVVPVAGGYLGMKAGARLASGGKRKLADIERRRAQAVEEQRKAIKNRKPQEALDAEHRRRSTWNEVERYYNDGLYGGFMGGGMGAANTAYWNYLASHPEARQPRDNKRRK